MEDPFMSVFDSKSRWWNRTPASNGTNNMVVPYGAPEGYSSKANCPFAK